MDNSKQTSQAHVLVFPYPIQGHINPMLQFSKRLATKGLKVTLVTTSSLSSSLPSPSNSPSQHGQVQVQPIFDGVQEGQKIDSHETYLKLFERFIPQRLNNLIEEHRSTNFPVKFIVYDCLIHWVLDLARKVGIDGAPFFTQSAAVHSIHYHVYKGDLRDPIEGSLVSVPSLPLLKVNEMPSLLVNAGPYPAINRFNINQSSNFDKAKMFFFNTTDKLENQILKWMTSKWPEKVKTIGPTIPSMYLDKRLEDDREYGFSIFQPERNACIAWLDAKETNSVIYISMGSLASLGEEQMEEIAEGLKKCDKNFLWVVRASEEFKLPVNFKNETSEKGLVVNWCPQLAVLEHRAIGCFLTHCGWNSTLEAISLGVPLVAMPQWTDQPTNSKYIVDVWKIGVRVKLNDKGIAVSDVIEGCIQEIMEGHKGRDIRRNMSKWKQILQEAMEEGGSSDKNIEDFAAKLIYT